MHSISALTLADARLFVSVSSAIVTHPEATTKIIKPLIATSKSTRIGFSSSLNLLRLLLVSSPIALSFSELSDLSSALVYAEASPGAAESELIGVLEKLQGWLENELQVSIDYPEAAIVQFSSDLEISLATKSHLLSFNIDGNTDPDASLFAFVRARCLQLGSYYDNVTVFAKSFETLKDYPAFESWLHGLILPYDYYHQNYAVPSDKGEPQKKYFSLKSFSDRFEFLIQPLNSHADSWASKLSPRGYFSNVILPITVYHDNNLELISEWMNEKHALCDSVIDFKLWDELLRTISGYHSYCGKNLPKGSYEGLLRHYIFSCLYFGIYKSEAMSSFTQTKIQTQIRDTLSYLVKIFGGNSASAFEADLIEFPEYASLSEFVARPPDFVKIVAHGSIDQCLDSTFKVFSTCCSLHSFNDLTVRKFFLLKAQANSNKQWFRKEVIQIFSRADSQNYDSILGVLSLFSASFPSSNLDTTRELDQLIFENFLQVENFQKAMQFFDGLPDERKLCSDTAFQLVNRKFWELFENSTNLDDRIGKLKLATNCVNILDAISKGSSLSEECRTTVVKIKHLLKAIHDLKNFKLVLVRNQPLTPKQILDRVTTSSGEKYPQFSVISLVLEQNPKSYLAHERLHKIVNDLAIYADLDMAMVSFPKIQSMSVESALIDGNFEFAYKQTKRLITYYVETKNTEYFNDIWLMFYQVGKYISSDWFGDYDSKVQEEKIDVLIKQREILSLAIKYTRPNTFVADNSRLLVGQFRHVNQEIIKWHEEADSRSKDGAENVFQSKQKQIQENLTGLLNEASHSKNQASEKISNLFVSGLGWAIGAKR